MESEFVIWLAALIEENKKEVQRLRRLQLKKLEQQQLQLQASMFMNMEVSGSSMDQKMVSKPGFNQYELGKMVYSSVSKEGKPQFLNSINMLTNFGIYRILIYMVVDYLFLALPHQLILVFYTYVRVLIYFSLYTKTLIFHNHFWLIVVHNLLKICSLITRERKPSNLAGLVRKNIIAPVTFTYDRLWKKKKRRRKRMLRSNALYLNLEPKKETNLSQTIANTKNLGLLQIKCMLPLMLLLNF